jgi:hypothetical protein
MPATFFQTSIHLSSAHIWLLGIALMWYHTTSGQENTFTPDSLTIPESDLFIISDETIIAETYPLDSLNLSKKPIPPKAAIMSAVFPGLGQIYNRKYWKVPIVYIAIGASTYFLIRYQNNFQRYRRAYIDLKDGDPYTNFHKALNIPASYEEERYITTYKDAYRGYRDWAILAVVISYFLNVVDANVDAHLFDYNVDDNLSLNVRPNFSIDGMVSTTVGLNLCFTF